MASDELRQRCAAGGVMLDGATGTELQRRGVSTHLPLWSAAALDSAPDVVRRIHADYVAAGAEIIVANTFRTNPRTLAAAGRTADGPRLNRLAITLARDAARGADRPVFVAASVAPVEDCYHPERAPDEAALTREHAQMLAWVSAAEPDLAWIETMNTVREARAAAHAARAVGLPLVVSFVLREDGALLGGEPLAEAVRAVEPYQPLALGLNCIPPRGVTAALPKLRALTIRPLAVYAHIGNPDPILGWGFSEELSPEQYAGYAREWRTLGANIVGGCCGTTPGHVAAVAAALRGR